MHWHVIGGVVNKCESGQTFCSMLTLTQTFPPKLLILVCNTIILFYEMCLSPVSQNTSIVQSMLSELPISPQPEQFKGHQTSSEGWGAPMATSTQMTTPNRGGGGMYSGAQQHDSGLNPVQQQTLNVISGCHNDHGINIKELIKTMSQHGHVEAPVR